MSTLTSWWRELPDSTALLEPDGRWVGKDELDQRVATVAGGLRDLGVGPGDRVVAFLPNGMDPVVLLLAVARLGAVTVGANTRYRAADLRHVLAQSGAGVLVCAEELFGVDLRPVVAEATAGLDVVVRRELPEGEPVTDDAAGPDDLLVAFTTSGTTGAPKLAAHRHVATVSHLRHVTAALAAGPDSTALLALPFCGTFGFVSVLAVLGGGGRSVLPPRFEPATAASLVEEHGVTHLNGSDDMLLGVLAAGRDLRTWRHGVHAEFTGRGAEAVARAAGVGAYITGVYGSSETFALLARWSPDEPVEARARNGGRLLDPAMEAGLDDDGQLLLRGPSVLDGYLEPDGVRPPPLLGDGWFPTGDLAELADGGFVYVARTGDALRLAGFLVDPAEIEQHLLAHPHVTGAQVVGVVGAKGEVAVAFVTVSASAEEADLVAHCRSLANFKVPTRVVVVDTFPSVDGPNGVKISKAALRVDAAALLAT